MTRVELTAARLNSEEGRRAFPYNDLTAKRVTCRPTGNLSIGVGINLEVGLDDVEINFLLNHRLTKTDASLRNYAWYPPLDEPRASVFLDVGFNDGVEGILHYVDTIHFAGLADWQQCAAALLDSDAARELPARYKALSQILLTG